VRRILALAALAALPASALPAARPALAVGPPVYVGDFAGPGLAAMYPTDVTSSTTHYFVLDTGRYRVVKVDRATGAIVDQVGGHQGRANGQFGAARAIAHDAAGNVFVADTANNRVQVFDDDLTFLSKWGTKGTDPGQLSQNYGIAVGMGRGAGGAIEEVVYVTDGSPGRVQKFELDGTFLDQFGQGHLNKARSVAVHPVTRDVYVVSAGDKKIAVFDEFGAFRFSFGSKGTGPGQFKEDPRGIAITAGGTVYVSDPGNHRIQLFDSDGDFQCAFGSSGSDPSDFVDIRGLSVTADGKLMVTDEWNYSLKEFALGSCATGFPFVRKLFGASPPVGGFNSPRGIDVNQSNGRVYIVDWWNQRAQRFESDGTGVLAWGFRGTRQEPGSFNFAWDIAVQPSTGRLFLANRESHEIEVFGPDGTFVTRWGKLGSTLGKFKFPQGVAFDEAGRLLIADSGNNRIQRCTIDSNGVGNCTLAWGSTGTAPGEFKVPTTISVAPDGTVWVADTQNNRVQKRNPATGAWTAYANPSGGTSLKLPWGVTVSPDGDIWIADSGKDRIVVMTASGVQLFAFTGQDVGAGAFDGPFDVAFGADGAILVSDVWNNRVVELV
jgi:DNA-binding beta-propeller fold protein YncE